MSDVRVPIEFEITSGSLTSSYTKHTIPLTKGGRTYKRIKLNGLDMSYTTGTSVATIDWYATYDSTGDKVALRNKQSTVVVGQTSNTGGVQETIETDILTDGNLYVWIKTDSPTATIAQLRATCRV